MTEMKPTAINYYEDPVELVSVSEFCKLRPIFKEGGVRHFIFQNGPELEGAGAIVKYGRRVLIVPSVWVRLVKEGFFKNLSKRRFK